MARIIPSRTAIARMGLRTRKMLRLLLALTGTAAMKAPILLGVMLPTGTCPNAGSSRAWRMLAYPTRVLGLSSGGRVST